MISLNEKRIAVFGIGKYMRDNFAFIDRVARVVCFSDNKQEFWGSFPLGDDRPCVRPYELRDFEIDFVLIAVFDRAASASIKKQVEAFGLNAVMLLDMRKDFILLSDEKQLESLKKNGFPQHAENSSIKRYVECYLLKQPCNMRCDYCFALQSRGLADSVVSLPHSPEFIAAALSKQRLGGTSLISICCDGEPLLNQDIVRLIELLLEEGHYVYVISNGTITGSMERLGRLPAEMLHRLFIRFSFHYFELQKRSLMDVFFVNIKRFRERGGSFTLFLVGSDEYTGVIEDIKRLSMEHLGALPHVDYVRDERQNKNGSLQIMTENDLESYKKIWETFDSIFLKYRESFENRIKNKCYAGVWVVHLDLASGQLSRCPSGGHVDNIFEDITRPIAFNSEPLECPFDFCVCAPVFFAFGMRPDYKDVPSFYELWNRVDQHGNSWIRDEAKAFFSGRLYESYGL